METEVMVKKEKIVESKYDYYEAQKRVNQIL